MKSNILSVLKVAVEDDDDIFGGWQEAKIFLPANHPGNNNVKWNGQNGYMSRNWPGPQPHSVCVRTKRDSGVNAS